MGSSRISVISNLVLDFRKVFEITAFVVRFKITASTKLSLVQEIVKVSKLADSVRRKGPLADIGRVLKDHPVLGVHWLDIAEKEKVWEDMGKKIFEHAKALASLPEPCTEKIKVIKDALNGLEDLTPAMPEGSDWESKDGSKCEID